MPARRAGHHALGGALIAMVALGCSRATPPPPPASVDASASAAPPPDGKTIVSGACLSCHSDEMLAQQRLPKEKWAATVKKMAGWGANLDPSDTETLVTYLAESYGPDAGPWEPEEITASAAKSALSPQDDGPFAAGSAANGKALFLARCAACHGPEARGLVGVNLVERPILYRAAELAATVRRGRGKMAPLPDTTDREIADLLAHLRSLRVP